MRLATRIVRAQGPRLWSGLPARAGWADVTARGVVGRSTSSATRAPVLSSVRELRRARAAAATAVATAPLDSTERVRVRGWVRSARRQKSVSFVEVNDGSSLGGLQVVAEGGLADGLTTGTSVDVCGTLVPSPRDPTVMELRAESIEVVGPCDAKSYPLQKKAHSLEFLREIMHLRPRSNTIGAVLRVRHTLSLAIHNFFHAQNFTLVHTPILTGNDCEGAGEMFRVLPAGAVAPTTASDSVPAGRAVAHGATPDPFFDRPAFLTVSGQLHAEAFALALGRVYTFGPTFRAENSNTSRHLAEFWMLEPEVAFANLGDNMRLAEQCIRACVESVQARNEEELRFFEQRTDASVRARLAACLERPFERLRYADAVRILATEASAPLTVESGTTRRARWGDDLSSEQERFLAEVWAGGRPVFVFNYPAAIKAFYMRRVDATQSSPAQLAHAVGASLPAGQSAFADDEGPTVEAMDLLVPRIGELVGGSVREERLSVLEESMRAHGLLRASDAKLAAAGGSLEEPSPLEWYLDLRRFGSVPHAGWGLGFERLVQFTTGIENIRDAIPVPRVPGSCRL